MQPRRSGFARAGLITLAAMVIGGCAESEAPAPASGTAGASGIAGMPAPHPGVPGEIGQMGGAGGGTDAGAAGSGAAGTASLPPPDAGAAGSGAAPAELAHGIAITEVALYQGVKIDLVRAGQQLAKLDSPVITGRPALVRVFVTPAADWQARPVVAQLGWNGTTRSITLPVSRASSDTDTGSTFNFELLAADLPAAVPWSITLRESAGRTGTGSTAGAILPATGTISLMTTSTGPSIKIVFVPVRYGGDRSMRVPDTSMAQLNFLTSAMFSTYPVSKVDATVHAPIDHAGVIDHLGAGWNETLTDVCALRKREQPARNVTYYGLVAPAATFDTYCQKQCVSGVAVLAGAVTQDDARCALGIGYSGLGSGVFLQEVAHTLGRPHAPCGGATMTDPNFPYQGGGIGVWGYDVVNRRLMDPATHVDFMSYCTPVWISDYTYTRLASWIQALNAL